MTKQQALDILMLLSALESWGFSNKMQFPDYLRESLSKAMETLEHEVLK